MFNEQRTLQKHPFFRNKKEQLALLLLYQISRFLTRFACSSMN